MLRPTIQTVSGDPSPRLIETADSNFRSLSNHFDNVLWFDEPSDLVTGDILYWSNGELKRLAIGSASQVLTVSSGAPAWAAASGGSGVTVWDTEIEKAADDTVTNSATVVSDSEL